MENKIKVVITGGAGFVGSHLANRLVKMGYDVHVIDNLCAGKAENIPPKATFHKKDITKLKDIEPIFNGASYVFHLAALPNVEYSIRHPLESHKTNVEGTLNVLRASLSNKVKKYIFASSSSVYGDGGGKKMSESTKLNPQSPYAQQKIIGEDYARLWSKIYGLNTLSLRFFNIYGPGQRNNGPYAFVIAIFLRLKSLGLPLMITGDGKQKRDFVHVNDVVNALIKSMRAKTSGGQCINIGSGKNHSINEIAIMIGGPVAYIEKRLEPKDTLCDNSLAKKVLNWQPLIQLEKGIKLLIPKENTLNSFKGKQKEERFSRKSISHI